MLTDAYGNVLGTADPGLAGRFNGSTWAGRWVRIDNDLPPPDWSEFADYLVGLDARIGKPGVARDKGWHHSLHAALFTEEVRQGEHGQAFVFLGRATRRLPKQKRWQHHAVLIRGERFSHATLRERVPHLRSLGDATVGILGLGTLGAPLAHALAQAQIGRLRLGDWDVVDPGTAVRWPAGLPAAGVHKAAYLAAEIGQHHPFVEVTGTDIRVGQTAPPGSPPGDSDREALARLVERADLVVDATAEDNVSRAFSDLAAHLGVPQLYVWSVDGYGGVVALLRPGRAGCFHCLSVALSDGGSIVPPPAASDREGTRVQPRGCADPTFVAAAPDMLPLVHQAARVALGMLTEDDPHGYGGIRKDVFVLAVREPDGSPLPAPQWRSYDLPSTGDCWYCNR